MSNIKELLEGVEVEWKSLGEVANITIGEFVHQDKQNPSARYPVYNGGIKPTGYYEEYNNKGNKVIVSARGANAGFVNKMLEPYWAGNSCYSISAKDEIQLNWEFVFYLLKSNENKMISSQQGGGIPAISKKQMESFQIPIPPLHIQSEIVRILDNFTELTAELTAELHARKKQYQFYRDKLLSFEDGEVEWKSLGKVVVRSKGTPITATQMKILDKPNAPVKIFAGGKTIAYFDYDDLPQKDINTFPSIIVKSRGVIEFEYYDKPFSHKNEMWSYHSEHNEINIKFIYYFLKTQEEQLRNKATSMGAFPQIAISDTEKLQIPIPPLAQQEKIVSILDKFDTLTNSISEGLPREIALRQQQYEYYRDLLLSFPKDVL